MGSYYSPLINCEIEIDLLWSKEFIIFEISITPKIAGNPNARPPVQAREVRKTTGAEFEINNAKLYVPVVAFSINDNIKVLENIKQGFKRTISWNKFRSEITTKIKNNNLNYLIDAKSRNINRLFVLSFKNGDDDPMRDSFDEYYMQFVEIKDFNTLIDNKPFFSDQPIKTHKKRLRNVLKCQKMMAIQQEIYWIIYIIRNIINLLGLICQDNQIRVFLHELI